MRFTPLRSFNGTLPEAGRSADFFTFGIQNVVFTISYVTISQESTPIDTLPDELIFTLNTRGGMGDIVLIITLEIESHRFVQIDQICEHTLLSNPGYGDPGLSELACSL